VELVIKHVDQMVLTQYFQPLHLPVAVVVEQVDHYLDYLAVQAVVAVQTSTVHQQVVEQEILHQLLQHKEQTVAAEQTCQDHMDLVVLVVEQAVALMVLQTASLALPLPMQVAVVAVDQQPVAVLVAQVAAAQEQQQVLVLHQLSVLQTLAAVAVVVLELLDLAQVVLVVQVSLLLAILLQEQTF
jgi:hypothetical protein